jgi:peptidoglycan/LPS O-acetylase OafA/YrhL
MTELVILPPTRSWGFAFGGLLMLVLALRRAPRDRVLLCQVIAYGAFVLLLLVYGSGTPDWFEYGVAATTVLFAVLAGYFGFLNFLRGWLERRKEAPQR